MTNNTMKITVKILITTMLWVSLSGCEWFNHNGGFSKRTDDSKYNKVATELITHGASGYIVLIGNMKFGDDSTYYDFKDIEDKSMPIEIITEDLNYDPNNYKKNKIKIRIGHTDMDYDIGSYKTFFGELKFEDDYYIMEEIFKLNDNSDTIFIDFVCTKSSYDVGIGLGENRYPTPLTSSQIEDSIRNGNYEITYIDLSYTPNALPRECYIIDGKIYTKSTLGDRWIYLCEQLPPLGYDETINEKHMIAMLVINKNKGNGFCEKNRVISLHYEGHYHNIVESDIPVDHFN